MKLKWNWIIGIVLILALIALPLIWRFFTPMGGYGMTLAPGASAGVRGYGYGMPMMHGVGMLAPFAMWFVWLLPLGVFILIGFAFGWAANQFTHKSG